MGIYDNDNKRKFDPDKYKNKGRIYDSFWGGIGWALLFAVIYGIYKLIEWLFI